MTPPRYTPAQLAKMSGPGDFPVPSRIKGVFSGSSKRKGEAKKRR